MKTNNHTSESRLRLNAQPVPASATKGRNPQKAYENLDFLHSPYGRSVRVLCELTEPLQRLNRMRIRNTVVFYGSARIQDPERARDALLATESAAQSLPPQDAEALLARARADLEFSRYYEDARQLAGDITTWSKTLPKTISPFYVCSGGGPGIMEAANRGASEVGGITLGLGISLPYEQNINPWVTQGLAFEYHYFFMRKFWFVSLARAIVVFPGGFGTMDELFELLTLVQTRKVPAIPIVLYGKKFWHELINWDAFVKWGLIDKNDLLLFNIVDSVEEAKSVLFPALNEYCREHNLTADPLHPSPQHHVRHPQNPYTTQQPFQTEASIAAAAAAAIATP
jgi:uncharacterized protein (TIGR00730 family)